MTSLYDSAAHQVVYAHATDNFEMRTTAMSADTRVAVRFPVPLADSHLTGDAGVRRMDGWAGEPSVSDIAAFEKSLESGSAAAAAQPTASGVVSDQVSLGELARELRAQREKQGQTQKEITLESAGGMVQTAPPGYTLYEFPSGGLTLFLPSQAEPMSGDPAGSALFRILPGGRATHNGILIHGHMVTLLFNESLSNVARQEAGPPFEAADAVCRTVLQSIRVP